MRFMVIVKADQRTEAGILPSGELLEKMGKYNEELAKAGVLLAGEGLQASSKGAKVRFEGSQRTVTDGPFTETKELIAGFWILQAGSLAEAIEWVKKAPMPPGRAGDPPGLRAGGLRRGSDAPDPGAGRAPPAADRAVPVTVAPLVLLSAGRRLREEAVRI